MNNFREKFKKWMTRENFQKLWKFILGMKVELAFFLYFAPGTLNSIGLELLPLEKACRINLNYSEAVCSNLNNGFLKESCFEIDEFRENSMKNNQTDADFQSLIEKIGLEKNFTAHELEILPGVCEAETGAQTLKTEILATRAPLGYLALIIVIFAGPLGDKYNRKKPFLLLPMVGELISVSAYLTTSVFKTAVPMEFHLYLELIANSITGGFSLMLMGVFSILAATTPEESRTFRFGVFSAFLSGAGIVLSPLASPVFAWLGYVNMFLLCLLIHVLGVVFIIFFIDEVPAATEAEKPTKESPQNENGVDNPAFDTHDSSTLEMQVRNTTKPTAEAQLEPTAPQTKTNIIRETIGVLFSNFKIFGVNRPFSGRTILWFTIIGYLLFGFSVFDAILINIFGRKAWGWTTEFAAYQSFNTAVGLVGTLIVTGIFVKVYKFVDPVLVIIAVSCRLVSRIIYMLTKDFVMIYVAGAIDMFNSAQTIAIRSLVSKVVSSAELGRAYSVMSVLETVIGPPSQIMYSLIYQDTINVLPSAFFILSIGLHASVIILFIKIYFIAGHYLKPAEEQPQNENGVERTTNEQ